MGIGVSQKYNYYKVETGFNAKVFYFNYRDWGQEIEIKEKPNSNSRNPLKF